MAATRRTRRSAAEIAILERRAAALEMRKQGMTYQEIGDQFKFTAQRAHFLVNEAIKALKTEAAADVIALELARLDDLQSAQWEAAISRGDPKAAETILKIMERRAKYLGADAPAKSEITGKDGGPVEIEMKEAAADEAKRKLAALLAAGNPGGVA